MREIFKGLTLPFVSHELSREVYLNSLSKIDQENVKSLVYAVKNGMQRFRDRRVGLIAYGSTARPERLRSHPADDVDIRLLTSAEPNSPLQKNLIDNAIFLIKHYISENNLQSKFIPTFTSSEFLVQRPDVYYLEYDNNDPSFIIRNPAGGLPIHLSISGVGTDTLDEHIKQEKLQKQYFSVLFMGVADRT